MVHENTNISEQSDEMPSPSSKTEAPVALHVWIACQADTTRSSSGCDESVYNLAPSQPAQTEHWQLQRIGREALPRASDPVVALIAVVPQVVMVMIAVVPQVIMYWCPGGGTWISFGKFAEKNASAY